MANIKNAVDAAKLNLLIIDILVRIKQVVMDFIVFANAAVIRKNELGQSWIIYYQRIFLGILNSFISLDFE